MFIINRRFINPSGCRVVNLSFFEVCRAERKPISRTILPVDQQVFGTPLCMPLPSFIPVLDVVANYHINHNNYCILCPRPTAVIVTIAAANRSIITSRCYFVTFILVLYSCGSRASPFFFNFSPTFPAVRSPVRFIRILLQ